MRSETSMKTHSWMTSIWPHHHLITISWRSIFLIAHDVPLVAQSLPSSRVFSDFVVVVIVLVSIRIRTLWGRLTADYPSHTSYVHSKYFSSSHRSANPWSFSINSCHRHILMTSSLTIENRKKVKRNEQFIYNTSEHTFIINLY